MEDRDRDAVEEERRDHRPAGVLPEPRAAAVLEDVAVAELDPMLAQELPGLRGTTLSRGARRGSAARGRDHGASVTVTTPAATSRGDRLVVVARLAEDLGRVLAEERRRDRQRPGRLAEAHDGRELRDRARRSGAPSR